MEAFAPHQMFVYVLQDGLGSTVKLVRDNEVLIILLIDSDF